MHDPPKPDAAYRDVSANRRPKLTKTFGTAVTPENQEPLSHSGGYCFALFAAIWLRSIAPHDFYANQPLRFHNVVLAAEEPDIGGIICSAVRDWNYMIVLDSDPRSTRMPISKSK